MVTEEEDDDDDNEAMIITSKLRLILAAKSRKLQYMSSPVISHHVSLSLLSSDDEDSSSSSRASVPFAWEDEPGKPKEQHHHHHHHHDLAPPRPAVYSKRLHLPPRLLVPVEFTKMPSGIDHHRRRLVGLKRWFWWKKERDVDDGCFVSSFGNGSDGDGEKVTSARGCIFDVTMCYFWGKEVPWKKEMKKMKKKYGF